MTTRTMSQFEVFACAQKQAQQTNSRYRVVSLGDRLYAIGTVENIDFHYPNVKGWNFAPYF